MGAGGEEFRERGRSSGCWEGGDRPSQSPFLVSSPSYSASAPVSRLAITPIASPTLAVNSLNSGSTVSRSPGSVNCVLFSSRSAARSISMRGPAPAASTTTSAATGSFWARISTTFGGSRAKILATCG